MTGFATYWFITGPTIASTRAPTGGHIIGLRRPQLAELARRLGADQRMLVRCVAFAFKEGIPKDSAFGVDARCLDNPYWVEPA